MKFKELVNALQHIAKEHGEDIDVDLEIAPSDCREIITSYPDFFIVPEKYDDGVHINLRVWPY